MRLQEGKFLTCERFLFHSLWPLDRPDATGRVQLRDDVHPLRRVRVDLCQYVLLYAHYPGAVGEFGRLYRRVRVVSAGAGHWQPYGASAGRTHVRHQRKLGQFVLRGRVLHLPGGSLCVGRGNAGSTRGRGRGEGKRSAELYRDGVEPDALTVSTVLTDLNDNLY